MVGKISMNNDASRAPWQSPKFLPLAWWSLRRGRGLARPWAVCTNLAICAKWWGKVLVCLSLLIPGQHRPWVVTHRPTHMLQKQWRRGPRGTAPGHIPVVFTHALSLHKEAFLFFSCAQTVWGWVLFVHLFIFTNSSLSFLLYYGIK